MTSIQLHDVKIHAFHGMYDGEKASGNPYVVNLEVKYEEGNADFDDLNSTINYVELYDIVEKRMKIPTGLLERVCLGIIRRVKHQYPFIKEIFISIHKLQAPIRQFEGKVGVSMRKTFND